MGKRRIVIIGAGGVITSHIKAIQANADRVELVGVSDIREERVEEVAKMLAGEDVTEAARMQAEQLLKRPS